MVMVAEIIVRNPARGRPLVSSASRRSRYRVGIFQPPERVNVHNVLVFGFGFARNLMGMPLLFLLLPLPLVVFP